MGVQDHTKHLHLNIQTPHKMSSAVAFNANTSVNNNTPSGPPSVRQTTRKRTAAIATRNANREVIGEEEPAQSQTADYTYGKDLSHTIRGETVLEPISNSRIAANPVKMTLKTRRSKSPENRQSPKSPSASRSKWQFADGVFTKAFIVFILVAGLLSTVWHWGLYTDSGSNLKVAVPLEVLASESRILELQDFLKKTTKMMQAQLELVDSKIAKEVEGLRKELEERIGEQAATFMSELRSLQAKTGEIEESLVKLTDSGVLSRKEVLALVTSVVNMRAAEGDGQVLSLDDVRAVAKQIVEAEIDKHSADGLGRVDYALGTGGGRVVGHSEGYFVGSGWSWGRGALDMLTLNFEGLHRDANKMLKPSFGEPGQCLPLRGSSVFVDVALRTSILPQAVTLEHVAKSVAYDRSSAPKDFRIFGCLRKDEDDAIAEAEQMDLLGEFSYDLEKSSVQTFDLPVQSTKKLINMIKLDVLSNQGSSTHTCIYRVRVHGSEPESYMETALEA